MTAFIIFGYLVIGFAFGVLSLILGSLWPDFGERVTEVFADNYSDYMTHQQYYEEYGLTKRENARFIFFLLLTLFWPVFTIFLVPGVVMWKLLVGIGNLMLYLSDIIDNKMRRY